MVRVRQSISAVAAVLAWAFVTQLVPNHVWNFGVVHPDAWRTAFEVAVGALLFYPVVHTFFGSDARYVWFAVLTTAGAFALQAFVPATPGMEWTAAVILAVALTGAALGRLRRRHA